MTGAIYSDWGDYLPPLLDGLQTSLTLAAASLAVGLPIGLLLALGVAAPLRPLWLACIVTVEVGRAVPALVLLQLAYYGLPSIELTLTSFVAGTAGLAWITAAYSSEIFRAGIASVPEGQREASSALGVAVVDTYRTIIIPQGLRVALPALLGLGIQIFQGTALAFTIALPELLSAAYDIGNQTFRFLSVLTLAGLLYVAVVIPAGILVRGLEVRMGRHLAKELR
jgi:polar amino acid transport system permease protein